MDKKTKGELVLNEKKSGLVFFSSPHQYGHTYKLLDLFIESAKGYDFNIIDCYKRNIFPCKDCGYCKKNPQCVFEDMNDIDNYLNTVDLLVFSSPVYNFAFPSQMKVILDRMQRYFSARFSLNIKPPIRKNKKGILLISCGSEDIRGIEIMELQLKKIFTVINCEFVGTVLLKGTDKFTNFPVDSVKKKIEEVICNL